ncbi:hypothetical protein FPV67DRAFT_791271 [Lyophyllum atratum]|nr:hypothetical protein FPV67DRAFT_791271 [Lyophyllum atratum]
MSPPNLTVPPSSVLIYSPRSIDDLKAPLSPTSSIKGVFVRSRPTSAEWSSYQYNDFPGIGMGVLSGFGACPTPSSSSEEESDASSSPATDDILAYTDRWASAHTDTRSLAPSTYTTTSRMRIVRRSDADMHAEDMKLARENHELRLQARSDFTAAVGVNGKGEKDKTRRRTWPSYKAIRKTVSNILHRKDSVSTPIALSTVQAGSITSGSVAEVPAERVKPSSASMFSRRRNRRRATTDADNTNSAPTEHKFTAGKPKRSASTSDALEYRAQLRRSRSFSGFTNVLSAIDDDEDFDEATAEARQLVANIRLRWAFEDVPEVDRDGYVFERTVE